MSSARSTARSRVPRSLHRLIEQWAVRTPEGIAIAAPGRAPLTYRRLLAQVDSVAEALDGFGIHGHDRVAIAVPNGPEMAVAFLGVAAGSCCAPLNPAYRANEVVAHLENVRASALIVEADGESAARAAAESLQIPVIALSPRPQREAGVFALECHRGSRSKQSRAPESSDVALVLQTSGTTSQPKTSRSRSEPLRVGGPRRARSGWRNATAVSA
jgi:acyl-CoA synthetase (AMP-forming)/AMP-acid ligase II